MGQRFTKTLGEENGLSLNNVPQQLDVMLEILHPLPNTVWYDKSVHDAMRYVDNYSGNVTYGMFKLSIFNKVSGDLSADIQAVTNWANWACARLQKLDNAVALQIGLSAQAMSICQAGAHAVKTVSLTVLDRIADEIQHNTSDQIAGCKEDFGEYAKSRRRLDRSLTAFRKMIEARMEKHQKAYEGVVRKALDNRTRIWDPNDERLRIPPELIHRIVEMPIMPQGTWTPSGASELSAKEKRMQEFHAIKKRISDIKESMRTNIWSGGEREEGQAMLDLGWLKREEQELQKRITEEEAEEKMIQEQRAQEESDAKLRESDLRRIRKSARQTVRGQYHGASSPSDESQEAERQGEQTIDH